MIKAILFDFDGTLANTLPLCLRAFREAIEPLSGKTLSDQEIVDTFGPSEEGVMTALLPEHLYDDGLHAYRSRYRELHDMCPNPFEGIREILLFLRERGVFLGLVTGKAEFTALISLEKYGLKDLFEALEYGSPEGQRKTEAIRRIMERHNLKPSETVYVGDAPSDIACSRKAGVRIFSVAWADMTDAETLRSLNPDELFTSVKELSSYLREHV